MWKKRDNQLLDIYKNKRSQDDFMLPLATVAAADSVDIDKNACNTIYSRSSLSQSHPSLLLLTSDFNNANDPSKAKRNTSSAMYQGNEFDVFGKEHLEEHFAPLYSIEQFAPTKARKERYIKGEILLRTEQEFKRSQVKSMIHDKADIKRRKTFNLNDNQDVTVIDGVFIKSTAAVNTPAASIFISEDNNHPKDEELPYY